MHCFSEFPRLVWSNLSDVAVDPNHRTGLSVTVAPTRAVVMGAQLGLLTRKISSAGRTSFHRHSLQEARNQADVGFDIDQGG